VPHCNCEGELHRARDPLHLPSTLSHHTYRVYLLNMDLDKPLDDMIASNRKPRGGNANGGGGGGGRPRQSRERGAPTPYAVSVCPFPCL